MDFLAGAGAACFLVGCATSGVLAAALAMPERKKPKDGAQAALPAESSGAGRTESGGTPGSCVQDVLEADRLRRECALELRSLALEARAMKLDLREALLQAAASGMAVQAAPWTEGGAAEDSGTANAAGSPPAAMGLPESLRGGPLPETPLAPDRGYLPDEEYAALTPAEKLQLELDRWPRASRTSAEAGLDYERWIAWLYEREGWVVRMAGALDGRADKGRDLLAWRRDMPVHIVQCKRWKDGPVREDVVMQLHGSCEDWSRKNPKYSRVQGVLVCTCGISDEALDAAQTLGIAACANVGMGWPPAVKCCGGEYLLPWDPGYDALKNFFRLGTVKEAEDCGFRHAGG